MKDNDLLVTELYKDPLGFLIFFSKIYLKYIQILIIINLGDSITALSVYLTPKLGAGTGNWIEIAYGTNSGQVNTFMM